MSNYCKRSTGWSVTRSVQNLYVEIASISASTMSKTKCVSNSLPEHSWITNPPKTICSRTLIDITPKFWSGNNIGSEVIDGFIVTPSFNSSYLLDTSSSSWANTNPYSIEGGGCLDTSKISNIQTISDNSECLKKDGPECTKTLFSKTDNFQVKGWSLEDYKEVTNGYEIYSYIIDIQLTWEARVKNFETKLSLYNDNHYCSPNQIDDLSFASSPDMDDSADLDSVVASIETMPYFMVALIANR
jgi:hypothetical protein